MVNWSEYTLLPVSYSVQPDFMSPYVKTVTIISVNSCLTMTSFLTVVNIEKPWNRRQIGKTWRNSISTTSPHSQYSRRRWTNFLTFEINLLIDMPNEKLKSAFSEHYFVLHLLVHANLCFSASPPQWLCLNSHNNMLWPNCVRLLWHVVSDVDCLWPVLAKSVSFSKQDSWWLSSTVREFGCTPRSISQYVNHIASLAYAIF